MKRKETRREKIRKNRKEEQRVRAVIVYIKSWSFLSPSVIVNRLSQLCIRYVRASSKRRAIKRCHTNCGVPQQERNKRQLLQTLTSVKTSH